MSAGGFVPWWFTVDGILSSERSFCEFMRSLSSLGLTNANGSSFRHHPICHFEDGILLVDHYNGYYCDIYIATEPDIGIIRGCNNPTVNGDPYPKPKTGEFISVWRYGGWLEEGPWVNVIKALIRKLINRLVAAKEERHRQQEEEERRRREEQGKKEKALLDTWEMWAGFVLNSEEDVV